MILSIYVAGSFNNFPDGTKEVSQGDGEEEIVALAAAIVFVGVDVDAGIYILQKIRNYANLKIQNGKTLPKLNIGIYSKFGQYYRYDITMYDFIHIIQFLIPIWSWISKMMLENETFFTFLLKCC